MGRQIVYCEGCGKRLTEDEFDKGKAQTIDNRPYCVECRPLEAPPPPRPPAPVKPATTRIPVPPSTRRQRIPEAAPSRSRAPLLAGGILGAAAVGIIVVAVLASVGRKPPASVPVPRPVPAPPREDHAFQALKTLQDFAAAATDPDAILLRCDEVRPVVQGTPHEAKFREIEDRAKEARTLKADASRLDNFLRQIRELREGDPRFLRKSEILGMLRSAAGMAGGRRAEVEKIIADYEKSFEETSAKAAEAARTEAKKMSDERKFLEAMARIDEYPESFRGTPHWAPLEALRTELAGKQAAWTEERKTGPWRAWRITSSGERGCPLYLDAWQGRSRVLMIHPQSKERPGVLEREIEIPAGRKATLSFWAAPHENGDWTLRVAADGQELLRQEMAPKNSGWKEFRVDLSAFAGRKVPLRLENVANNWDWEYSLWSDVAIRFEGDEGALILPAGKARFAGKVLQLSAAGPDQHLMGWNFVGDRAEWSLEVPRAGKYTVEIVYSCGVSNHGEYTLTAAGEQLAGKITPTGSWDKVQTAVVGTISLPPGAAVLEIRATKTGGGLMNLRRVRLLPEL
jgi:hypothetical protein